MKLTLLSPVSHDGRDYAEGDALDIKDEAQAQALIDAGVAKQTGKKSKAEEKSEADAAAKAAAEAADAAAREAAALADQPTETGEA